MTESRVTSRQVKLAVIDKAQYLLERVGCDVNRTGMGDVIKFEIFIPPNSVDPHGERLNAARTEALR